MSVGEWVAVGIMLVLLVLLVCVVIVLRSEGNEELRP